MLEYQACVIVQPGRVQLLIKNIDQLLEKFYVVILYALRPFLSVKFAEGLSSVKFPRSIDNVDD